MKNQVLSIDQCKELLELGIDMSGATMSWYELGDGYVLCNDATLLSGYFSKIPTFTLQDILDMLPQKIYLVKDSTRLNDIAFIQINKTANNGYNIAYEQSWDTEGKLYMKMHGQQLNKSLLIAAFNLLKWCKTNSYI